MEFHICNIKTDWSQFWPGMISTFVGFGLALLGQFLWGRVNDYFTAKNLLNRIENELLEIESVLEIVRKDSIEIQPLKTLVWDEAINTGLISLLKDSKRELLFKIYKQIQEFNSWFAVKTNYYFDNGEHNTMLNNEIENQQNILLGKNKEAGKISIGDVVKGLK